MKINLPVTQREIPFPPGVYLVSKTNLKGIITYANEAFVNISGYSHEELMGKNHNIVRHPDMPPQAFADLWHTVKSGLPWRGIVKNRTKGGDYYWVDALVVPLKENGEVTGYMSTRTPPNRAAIAEAEAAYRQLMDTKASLDTRQPWWRRLSIRTRLLAFMLFMVLMLIGGALVGLGGIMLTNTDLKRVYELQLEPIEQVGRIATLMADNRAQVALALQHDSKSQFAGSHDHSVDQHTDAIIKNRDQITELTNKLQGIEFANDVRGVLEAYLQARTAYVNEGLVPARQALLEGNFTQANRILLEKVNPLYTQAATLALKVQETLKVQAHATQKAVDARYERLRNLALVGTCLGLLLVILGAFGLLRAIVRPLKTITDHFDSMAQGNLTDDINISGRDESGSVLTQLAVLQVQLKVMLDEIQVAARTIEGQAKEVDSQTGQVVKQSGQQQSHAASIASATEQLSHSAEQVSDSARQTASAAHDAQTQVVTAQVNMHTSTQATGRVVEAVQASSRTISDLSQSIGKIGDISQTIREIADQTNLLALNAAIEAARAGESGRGFAVVADEVRKLAERTSGSTADITNTVIEIRKITDSAVASMGNAVKEVEEGIGNIQQSMAGLAQITESSQAVTAMARQIADAANEQSMASRQVADSMDGVATLIQGNLAAANDAKSATDSLRGAAVQLRQVVGRFRVR